MSEHAQGLEGGGGAAAGSEVAVMILSQVCALNKYSLGGAAPAVQDVRGAGGDRQSQHRNGQLHGSAGTDGSTQGENSGGHEEVGIET